MRVCVLGTSAGGGGQGGLSEEATYESLPEDEEPVMWLLGDRALQAGGEAYAKALRLE